MHTVSFFENLKGRDYLEHYLEHLGVVGKIMSEWILREIGL